MHNILDQIKLTKVSALERLADQLITLF